MHKLFKQYTYRPHMHTEHKSTSQCINARLFPWNFKSIDLLH